jgi:hypothetical protein
MVAGELSAAGAQQSVEDYHEFGETVDSLPRGEGW